MKSRHHTAALEWTTGWRCAGKVALGESRDGRAVVPRGDQRIEVGDEVVLFARREEAALVELLFPGGESI